MRIDTPAVATHLLKDPDAYLTPIGPFLRKSSLDEHGEGDLIIGKNNRSALGTLVERTTRTTILVPVKSKEAEVVAKSFAKEVKKLPRQMKLSMTYDQGREMAQHKLFTDITGVKVYFAHPRSPWERGTNENTNGLIRQFFPKETDLIRFPDTKLKRGKTCLTDGLGSPSAFENLTKYLTN